MPKNYCAPGSPPRPDRIGSANDAWSLRGGENVTMALGEDYPEIRDVRASHLRPISRRVLARAGDARAYPTEFVKALTERRLPRGADPGGIRRLGAAAARRGASSWRRSTPRAATRPRPCADVHHGHAAAARQPEQKQKYLPEIARGELRLQAFGVTEPTTGSDTTKLKTRAERRGDHYVITGQKVWTSRALHSDLMLLLARTTPRGPGQAEDRGPVGVPGRHRAVPRQGPGDPAARRR